MRSVTGGLLAFSLKEEGEIINRLVQAIARNSYHIPSHQKNFKLMVEFLIRKDSYLKEDTFHNFCNILDELGIRLPELNYRMHKGNYNGSAYVIADSDENKRNQKIQKRRDNRNQSWEENLIRFGLDEGEIERRLMDRGDLLIKMQDNFTALFHRCEEIAKENYDLRGRIEQLENRLNEQRDEEKIVQMPRLVVSNS